MTAFPESLDKTAGETLENAGGIRVKLFASHLRDRAFGSRSANTCDDALEGQSSDAPGDGHVRQAPWAPPKAVEKLGASGRKATKVRTSKSTDSCYNGTGCSRKSLTGR